MIGPQITHMPCDLNQQKERAEARRDSIARAVARANGRRSLIDRLFRREVGPTDLTAEDLRHVETEDVGHAFRI